MFWLFWKYQYLQETLHFMLVPTIPFFFKANLVQDLNINKLMYFPFLFFFSGILVPGGFGVRGVEGKILAANWARTRKIPYLGYTPIYPSSLLLMPTVDYF